MSLPSDDPAVVRKGEALVEHVEEARAHVVRELYDRGRSSILTLIAIVALFGWTLVSTQRTDGTIRGLFVFLIAVSVLRWILTIVPAARRDALASVRMQLLVFAAGVALTSCTLAMLIMCIWPILQTAHFAILAAVVSGIVSGAVMSLGSSPLVYLLYMSPPMGAMFLMAITDSRPPWGANLLATAVLLYAAMSVVMTVDHARTRRRGIYLSVQLSDLALRDALTKLRNRRFLHEYMAVEEARLAREATALERAQKVEHDDAVAVYMIDLDHFKSVNDSFGHTAGDDILKQLAETIAGSVRKSDVLVRWGGEEFVIVARIHHRGDAPILAESLRRRVEASEFHLPGGATLQKTCSIGFCTLPFSVEKPRQLGWEQALGLADAALYIAKQEGRNRWVGVEPGVTPWPESPSAYVEIRDNLIQACEDEMVVLRRSVV